MDTENLLKNNWLWIVGGIILLIIIISFIADSNKKETPLESTQSQIFEPQNIQDELTPKQKEVKDYLIEIRDLSEECRRGDIYIGKAGQQLQSGNDGIALANCSSAQAIYESVLEKIQQLEIPAEGQNLQANFLEATQAILSGIKMMRLGLEKQPINEDKIWQGLEIYGKGMLPLARMNEEILRLKEKVGLK